MSPNDLNDSCSSLFIKSSLSCETILYIITAAFVFAGFLIILAAGICWLTIYHHKERLKKKLNPKIGIWNPSFSTTKFNGTSSDRRLAQSAQMYHYQHQKQLMMALETAEEDKADANNSHIENEETVYECPGFASTGEIVVQNPLFNHAFELAKNGNFKSYTTTPDSVTVKMDSNKKNFE